MASARKRKKIVILTLPVGGGHLTAAKIVDEALRDKAKGAVIVKTIDIMDEWIPGSPKFFAKSYEQSVKNLNSAPYKLSYDFANAQPKLVDELFGLFFNRLADRIFKREMPDLVVSTFPIVSYLSHKSLQKSGQTDVPIVSVITDAGAVHRLWLMGVEDTVITATKDTIDYAVSQGVPREKLHYFGFPVLKHFSRLPSRVLAREKLGLENKPTVVITSGGLGMNPKKMVKIVEELARRKVTFQVEVICGKNENLYDELSKIDTTGLAIHLHKFVTNMPLLLAASDVVCSKAGWLTVSETIAARRPMILFNIIPGQEEPNASYVVKNGYGEVITDPVYLVDRLEGLLCHEQLLKGYDAAFKKRLSGRTASRKIAEFILAELKVETTDR